MYWETNLKALSQCGRCVTEIMALQNISDDDSLQLFETANGFSVLYQGIALHHPEEALTEAHQLINRDLHPDKHNIHLIFGLGLGYLLQLSYEQSEGSIVIYEPHQPLLKFLLTHIDFSEYFADPRVSLCTTPETLQKSIFNFIKMEGFLDGLILPGYGRLFDAAVLQEAKRRVEAAIKSQQGYFKIGLTLNPQWQQVAIRNIPLLSHAYDASALIQAHHSQPAIVLSAGPSLDRYMADLQKYKDQVILIAVGAALKPLLSAGIQPDYVCFLDFDGPQYQLADLDTQGLQLLLGPFVHELAWQVPCRRRYLISFSNYDKLSDWYDEHLGIQNARVGSGGSVSIMATHAALMMGCNPVILLGQDLAFAGTQQYAGNVHVTLDGTSFTAPASHVHEGRTLPYATIMGQQGETLLTSPDYVMFQTQFEDLAACYLPAMPGLRLINASIGGALLPGFEHQALPELAACLGWTEASPHLCIHKPLMLQDGLSLNPLGFSLGLRSLQQQVTICIRLGQHLKQQQQRWKKSVSNHGAGQAMPNTLSDAQSQFVEALQASWIIYGCLGQEIWLWQDAVKHKDVSPVRIQFEMDCVNNILDKLEKDLAPALAHSITGLSRSTSFYYHA